MKALTLFALNFVLIISLVFANSYARNPAAIDNNFKNWGLFNTVSSSHINVESAWKLTEGDKSVVVAIVDTGIDPEHPDLKNNLWKDSKTGVYGWDFTTNKANPTDSHGHGTHIAGIIGASLNKSAGISGVAHKVSLMILKYYNPNASGDANLKNSVKAIEWAVDHGADIINYSGGGAEFSDIEYKAMKHAKEKGVLVVAAAGNERSDIDKKENRYYPASYDLDNIISVGGIDIKNKMLKCSNYGKEKVLVAAPGESIYSTVPGKGYGYMTGTSQSTAFVSGLAALVKSVNKNLKPFEIKNIIASSVDANLEFKDKFSTSGKINALNAVKMATNLKGLTPLNAKKIIGTIEKSNATTAKSETISPVISVNKYQLINERRRFARETR